MATSGSYDYSLTADDIITAAAENLEVLRGSESLSSADYAVFLRELNLLAKQWSGMTDFAPGLKVFSRKRVGMWLENGQQQYSIGPSLAKASVQWGRTTIDAAEASGQTVISVTATTDTTTFPGTTVSMTAADVIGIQMDDGTIHWSTISSVAAGDTVTIADATSDTAAVGNYVWWFTSYAQRFENLEAAVLRNSDYFDSPLDVFSTVHGYDMTVLDKYADGDPTALLIEPQLTSVRILLDAQPNDVTKMIILTVLYPMEDYDNASGTDDIAYPQVWYSALEYELAKRCSAKFRKRWTKDQEELRRDSILIAQNQNPQRTDVYFKRDD